ncbi:hypothetical protein FKW77_007067 [Venturia effusa]|uniref:Uncharacterized protein n=1 Tax=Venturia effusa TaxID=50376 RepID=A0A517LP92_9PEZI|nr:hypothetical protein FKW77_007067 [Venturia effusa]
MATKSTSFLSLPRELRQDILLRYMNGCFSKIYGPEWVIKSRFIHWSQRYFPRMINRKQFVETMREALEKIEHLTKTLAEVAEDVTWAKDWVRAHLTKTTKKLRVLKDGETLEEMSARLG